MNGFASKATGWLAVLAGIMGALAIVTLLLFFVGLFQNIHSLSFMGGLNDRINALTGFLGGGNYAHKATMDLLLKGRRLARWLAPHFQE